MEEAAILNLPGSTMTQNFVALLRVLSFLAWNYSLDENDGKQNMELCGLSDIAAALASLTWPCSWRSVLERSAGQPLWSCRTGNGKAAWRDLIKCFQKRLRRQRSLLEGSFKDPPVETKVSGGMTLHGSVCTLLILQPNRARQPFHHFFVQKQTGKIVFILNSRTKIHKWDPNVCSGHTFRRTGWNYTTNGFISCNLSCNVKMSSLFISCRLKIK